MNSQEKELRDSLSDDEIELMNGQRFSICDIVWKRINENYLRVTTSSSLLKYYNFLGKYLLVLNSNKDYKRAVNVALRIQFLDCCGWSRYDDGWQYDEPDKFLVVNAGSQYLAKSIRLSRISIEMINNQIEQQFEAMLAKVPFSYVSLEDFKAILYDLIDHLNNGGTIKYDFKKFFPNRNLRQLADEAKRNPSVLMQDESADDWLF